MMPDVSLSTFARYVNAAADGFRAAERKALDDAGKRIVALAKAYLGHYQTGRVGPFGPWAPLAQATLDDKLRQGYPTPSPLLREGDLRDSIEHEVDRRRLTVGSAEPVAAYQEFGTDTIPPRPFIGRSMAQAGPGEAARLGAAVFWPILRRSIR